jgi:CBS domain containing-hemolysin-like protein
MRATKFMLDCMWYGTYAALFGIWVVSIFELGRAGAVPLFTCVILIPLLFALEGLELAITALLDRSASVHGRAGSELARIQKDKLFGFFSNRELFVVVGIVLLTSVGSLDAVYVPGRGWISDHLVTFSFNLAFSTLVVLLVSQIPSKRLALQDPERFYRSTWPICVAVRWVGASRITQPGEALSRVLSSFLGYPARRRTLAPTLAMHYDSIDGCWCITSSDQYEAPISPKSHPRAAGERSNPGRT